MHIKALSLKAKNRYFRLQTEIEAATGYLRELNAREEAKYVVFEYCEQLMKWERDSNFNVMQFSCTFCLNSI